MEKLFTYIAVKLTPVSRPLLIACVLMFILDAFDSVKGFGFNAIFPLTPLMLWLVWLSVVNFTFEKRADISGYPNIYEKSYFDDSSEVGKIYTIFFLSFYLVGLIFVSIIYAVNI